MQITFNIPPELAGSYPGIAHLSGIAMPASKVEGGYMIQSNGDVFTMPEGLVDRVEGEKPAPVIEDIIPQTKTTQVATPQPSGNRIASDSIPNLVGEMRTRQQTMEDQFKTPASFRDQFFTMLEMKLRLL